MHLLRARAPEIITADLRKVKSTEFIAACGIFLVFRLVDLSSPPPTSPPPLRPTLTFFQNCARFIHLIKNKKDDILLSQLSRNFNNCRHVPIPARGLRPPPPVQNPCPLPSYPKSMPCSVSKSLRLPVVGSAGSSPRCPLDIRRIFRRTIVRRIVCRNFRQISAALDRRISSGLSAPDSHRIDCPPKYLPE